MDTWSGALIPLHGATDAGLVRVTRRAWTLNAPTDLTATTAMAGYRRQNTEVMTSEVKAGWVDEQRKDGEPAKQAFAYGASITGVGRALGLPVDARGEFTHDVVSTGLAEVWRSRPGLWAALRWERRLDVQDGYFNEVALRTFGTIEVHDTLGTSTFVTLDGGGGRARPLSSEEPAVKFGKISGSLARRLQARLTGRISYTYSWRHETHGASTFASFRSRAEVALTAAL